MALHFDFECVTTTKKIWERYTGEIACNLRQRPRYRFYFDALFPYAGRKARFALYKDKERKDPLGFCTGVGDGEHCEELGRSLARFEICRTDIYSASIIQVIGGIIGATIQASDIALSRGQIVLQPKQLFHCRNEHTFEWPTEDHEEERERIYKAFS